MKKKVITSVVAVLLALSAWLLGFVPQSPLGGSVGGQQFNATTTRSTSGSGTYSYPACLGTGTFGSIVVVQPATAGYVRVWNATSTATSTYQTTSSAASTLTFGVPVAQVLSASDVVGTLTFDSLFTKGVIVETASDFNGEYIITCKQ